MAAALFLIRMAMASMMKMINVLTRPVPQNMAAVLFLIRMAMASMMKTTNVLTRPVLSKYGGCPIPDTDGDGINDENGQVP